MTFGELEHLILLEIMRLDGEAFAIRIRDGLETEGGRSVTRGALYRSLDRLAQKGLVSWANVEPSADRGGHVRRRFRVTEPGRALLSQRRETLLRLWEGLEGELQP